MRIGLIVALFIAVITFFGYCIIASTDVSEEEQRREDEEQLEWLRKRREKDGDSE